MKFKIVLNGGYWRGTFPAEHSLHGDLKYVPPNRPPTPSDVIEFEVANSTLLICAAFAAFVAILVATL